MIQLRRRVAALTAVLIAAALLAVQPAQAGTSGAVTAGPVAVSPGLAGDLASLPADAPYGVFAHFAGGTPETWRGLLEDHGLEVLDVFESVDVAFGVGTIGDVRTLTHSTQLTYLEKNEEIALLDETASWATRVRVAQEPVAGGPYRVSPTGPVLDGADVGVAIIDSGADTAHPDLANRVEKDYKVVCSLVLVYTDSGRCFPDPIEMDPGVGSDTSSGHGTHVAGIIAGDGTASNGTFKGVAPGAKLFTFGVGEGRNLFFVAQAYDFLVDEYETFTPRIRVVNNSWGNAAGTAYDPNGVVSKLVVEAANLGVTSVFAAGNDGTAADKGDADDLSGYAKDPTPGVITVANYSDAERGDRDNTLDDSSSRGKAGAPVNYPDISAPGSLITSTCNPRLPLCNLGPHPAWAPNYNYMSGTSMAAPHVAGVAALLYQSNPDLTPAQVEDILQDTAYKYGGLAGAPGVYEPDPQNTGGTISYDKGAGLVDAVAALNALGVAHDGAPVVAEPTVSINDPAEGASVDGVVKVTGTAFDAVPTNVVPAPVAIAEGDGGDYSGPGAADIVGLQVAEKAAGLEYTITVRNLSDLGLAPSVGLRVTQKISGKSYLTSANVTPTGVTPASPGTSNTAVASTVTADRAANTVTMFVPFTALGDPVSGSPGYTAFASSFVGAIADFAPGGIAAEVITAPQYGRPFTVVRPKAVVPPAAEVTLSVADGVHLPAKLSGSSPAYDFEGSVDLSDLPEGTQFVTATLRLDGVVAAIDTVGVVIERPITYAVAITSPRSGETVPLQTVDLAGTAVPSRASTADQSVTVAVTGPGYDSGELPATGIANWIRSFDFGVLRPEAYTVTARYYADGALADTHTISVVVPVPTPGSEVSYRSEGIGWWRQQFVGGPAQSFTRAEADRLADRAVQLSSGRFATRDALTTALLASGSLSADVRAARQYAGLVLNLAAGDLSRLMSSQVGLSGAERLDRDVYDVRRVGPTVDSAAEWVRGQFRDGGDLSAANEVATTINGGGGLL